MKGIELPINVLVIVVIVVIVLIAVIAVYFTGWTPYASSAGLDATKNDICRRLVMGHGCNVDPDQIEITTFDADNSGTLNDGDNLQDLCDNFYATGGDVDACKAICGCGGVVNIIGGGGGGGGGGSACTACSLVWDCSDCDDECGSPALQHDTGNCVCTPPGCTGGQTCTFGAQTPQNGEIVRLCSSLFYC